MSMRPIRPLLMAALLLSACGTQMVNPVTGRTELSVMDEATEIQEGAKAHEGVVQEYGVYPDLKLQAYVNELGQKLASQSDMLPSNSDVTKTQISIETKSPLVVGQNLDYNFQVVVVPCETERLFG